MDFKYFSKNGELRPMEEAIVPLSNIEYQYGFGVYETIRVTKGKAHFLDEHLERLFESARILGLEHPFEQPGIESSIAELAEKNGIDSCNLKILLLGAKTAAGASLSILPLNPLFPDKKLYRDGVHLVTYEYERAFPHAKSLNMLESYLAYRKAHKAGAYDALLVDSNGCVTEGTRTNFFLMKGTTLYSAPESEILLGVTRKHVLEVAKKAGFAVEHRHIKLAELRDFDAACITSTSSKILPVKSVEDHPFGPQTDALKELIRAFDEFLGATS